MCSIHYKFRALVAYKTLNFDELNVSVEDLKWKIFETENLNPENTDLKVQNSHTKREYSTGDIIPRNSSLIIIRMPRQDGPKISKVQDTSTSGIVSKNAAAAPDFSFIQTEDFAKMSEEERIKHVKQVSFQKYDPSTYSRKPTSSAYNQPPPPSYICNRCGRNGHWHKNCPMANIKRTTGIPMEELVETTADDPYAMLHPSGKYMVQKMHLKARQESKAKAPLPFATSATSATSTTSVTSTISTSSPKISDEPSPPQQPTVIKEDVLPTLQENAKDILSLVPDYNADIFQPIATIDPVTGQLSNASNHHSSKRRSSASSGKRHRRSPSPSSSRKSSKHRKSLKHEKSSKHDKSSKKHKKSSKERKIKKEKTIEEEPEENKQPTTKRINEPMEQDEYEIDSLIKEIETETIKK
ncbi:hypothetical protein M3Y98_01061100 [Aphelenchoides besseyi]|nr:hypothetical protein M3Y98_01061100 [Aphelenchoides besseyi]KAI6209700.1 hypothetical protein M3Y96_00248600 [Aphelenchoides besseyi]